MKFYIVCFVLGICTIPAEARSFTFEETADDDMVPVQLSKRREILEDLIRMGLNQINTDNMKYVDFSLSLVMFKDLMRVFQKEPIEVTDVYLPINPLPIFTKSSLYLALSFLPIDLSPVVEVATFMSKVPKTVGRVSQVVKAIPGAVAPAFSAVELVANIIEKALHIKGTNDTFSLASNKKQGHHISHGHHHHHHQQKSSSLLPNSSTAPMSYIQSPLKVLQASINTVKLMKNIYDHVGNSSFSSKHSKNTPSKGHPKIVTSGKHVNMPVDNSSKKPAAAHEKPQNMKPSKTTWKNMFFGGNRKDKSSKGSTENTSDRKQAPTEDTSTTAAIRKKGKQPKKPPGGDSESNIFGLNHKYAPHKYILPPNFLSKYARKTTTTETSTSSTTETSTSSTTETSTSSTTETPIDTSIFESQTFGSLGSFSQANETNKEGDTTPL